MNKILYFLLVVIVTFISCTKEDMDSIRADQADLIARVSALEKWQTAVNADIASLQAVVSALETNDYVTDVSELSDGSGYVLTFVKSGAVTIKHGNSSSSMIGVKEDNGVYYWTLNGEFLVDENNNRLSVTGVQGEQGEQGVPGTSAPTPVLKMGSTLKAEGITQDADGTTITDDAAIYLSINGTDTWTKVSGDKGQNGDKGEQGNKGDKGDKGEQGDAIFKKGGIDTTNADYVILTLADGVTTISLPRYKSFTIGTDTGNKNTALKVGSVAEIPLSLPTGFKESDYTAIMAQVISDQGTGNTITTRAATTPWSVTVKKPTFSAGTCNNDATVTVTTPTDISIGETALLRVTLVGSNGSETVATRALTFEAKMGDYYYSDGTFSDGYIASKTPIGVIFYVGDVAKDDSDLKNKIGDTSTGVHGLVVALKDASTYVQWQGTTAVTGVSTEVNKMNGYANTLILRAWNANGSNSGKEVTAITKIDAYNHDNATPSNSSGWYFPSIKELSTLCSGWRSDVVFDDIYGGYEDRAQVYTINGKLGKLKSSGLATLIMDDWYWSSSECSASIAATPSVFIVTMYDGWVGSFDKDEYYYLRPILAF